MFNNIKSKSNLNIYTLVLFIILTILPLFDAGFDNNMVIYMLFLALGSLIIKNNIYKKSIYIYPNNPIFWYTLYIIWCGLSFIWSIYYIRTMIEFFELLLYGLVFYITTQLDDEANDKVISVVLLIGSGIALFGILEYIIITNTRIVSTFTNPNPFGTYLLILFLFSWGLTLRKNNIIMYFISLVFLVALLLSGSRGAFFSTILAFPFIFIGCNRNNLIANLLKTIILILFGILITKFIIFIAPLVQNKIGLSSNLVDILIRKDSLIGSSLVGRLEFWKVAWELIKNKPINGYGLGTFFSAYYIEYTGNQWYSRFVHNNYLQMMAETGVIGVSLFLVFLLCNFKIIWQELKNKDYSIYLPGTLAAIIGFLLHIGAEFSWNFPGATVIFFWLLGMSIRKGKIKEAKQLNFKCNYNFNNIVLLILLVLVLYNFTFFKLFNLAARFSLEDKKDKALGLVEFSNKYYPISPYGRQLEGNYYYSLYESSNSKDSLNKAILIYEEALKLAPYDGGIHNKLGDMYLEYDDLRKAEEHLYFGAKYGAYNINRYLDLGLFYLNQNRVDEAEETFINGTKLKKYAIKSADSINKDSMVINGLTLHAMLYNIYKANGQVDKLNEQIDELNNMMDAYPFLKDYFKIEMFVN